LYFKLTSGEEWVKGTSLEMAFEALGRFVQSGMKYRIVGGNTGTGKRISHNAPKAFSFNSK